MAELPIMRAARAVTAFDYRKPGWLYEVKLDGHRAWLSRVDNAVRLRTREGTDITAQYPHIAAAGWDIPARQFIMDGELVVGDAQGLPRLDLVRERRHRSRACLYAFDLLQLDGENMRPRPLVERKAHLAALLTGLERHSPVQFLWHTEDGEPLLRRVSNMGLEGVMAKRAASTYRPGQHEEWVKLPCYLTLDCLVIGVSKGYRYLHLAVMREDRITYVGSVAHRLDRQRTLALQQLLAPQVIAEPVCPAPRKPWGGVHWLTPTLWCQVRSKVAYHQTGRLRDPKFVGFLQPQGPRG